MKVNMASLKNRTSGQLEKMLANTNAEINRRKQIEAATTEIRAILKKYKLGIQDVELQALNKKAGGKSDRKSKATVGARDKRTRVKAKYASSDGANSWSGRGRAPAWVMELCEKEGMDLDAFKKDSRFIQA